MPFLNRPAWSSSSCRGWPPRLPTAEPPSRSSSGTPGADQDRSSKWPVVVERELDPAAASAAEAAAARRRESRPVHRRRNRREHRRPPGPRGPAAGLAPPPGAAARLTAAARTGRRPDQRRRRSDAPAEAAGRRLRADRLGEIEPPAQLLAIRAREIDRPAVDAKQLPVGVAQEAVGEGGLDLGRRGREGGDRVEDPAAIVIGVESQIVLAERLQGQAELEDPPIVGGERGIAAVDPADLDRLAANEIEHPHIGRDQHRIAELLHRRRAVLVGDRGDEVELLDRRPVEPGAERAQRAEIGEMLDLGVEVDRKVAERLRACRGGGSRSARRDWPGSVPCRRDRSRVWRSSAAQRLALEAARVDAGPKARRHLACRQA